MTVYSTTGDSYVTRTIDDSNAWGTCRGNALTAGDAHSSSASTNNYGVYARRNRGDLLLNRSYFIFDLSSESSGTIESATISIRLDSNGTSGDSSKAVLVEATALDDSTADFGNVFDGLSYGDDISSVETVTNFPSTPSYTDFTLNSDGIALAQSALDASGSMTVALVSHHYDFSNSAPPNGGNYTMIKVWYADMFGTTNDPKLVAVMEGAATDSAIFFGANF